MSKKLLTIFQLTKMVNLELNCKYFRENGRKIVVKGRGQLSVLSKEHFYCHCLTKFVLCAQTTSNFN